MYVDRVTKAGHASATPKMPLGGPVRFFLSACTPAKKLVLSFSCITISSTFDMLVRCHRAGEALHREFRFALRAMQYEPVPSYAGKMFQPMPAALPAKSEPAKHTL
jgi:hypothetical protein